MKSSLNRHVFGLVILATLFFNSCSSPNEQTTTKESIQASETEKPDKRKTVLFFGDSITAGYRLEIEQAFPAIIQLWMDSLGYSYQSINAGLSGETTAGGKSRIEWVLRTVPDIFFLELGANDGLRGLQLGESKKNLQAIIDAVKTANPNVEMVLVGMQVPPNLGQDYTDTFQRMFPDLAKENKASLIPFILEGVAGDPKLNLEDGIHPTPEGHLILAETVWKYLEPLLLK